MTWGFLCINRRQRIGPQEPDELDGMGLPLILEIIPDRRRSVDGDGRLILIVLEATDDLIRKILRISGELSLIHI